MIKGKTESGFEFEINEKVAKDGLTLKYLSKVLKDDLTGVYDLIDRMVELGLDEKALYDHCMDEDGIVPLEKLVTEIVGILKYNSETKNS